MRGFLEFIRQQRVLGLAIGFILGAAVSNVITSLVSDIVYPLLGVFLGSTKGLEKETLQMGHLKLLYGHFLSVLINFLVISVVVYLMVVLFRLELTEKKK